MGRGLEGKEVEGAVLHWKTQNGWRDKVEGCLGRSPECVWGWGSRNRLHLQDSGEWDPN